MFYHIVSEMYIISVKDHEGQTCADDAGVLNTSRIQSKIESCETLLALVGPKIIP